VTRATRGTAEAGHAASTTAYWIQHDVWIYYDDATLAAPTVDDDYKPAFDLDSSTNASWVYTEFGEDDGLRAAQWESEIVDNLGGDPVFYTANRGTDADPHEEIGIKVSDSYSSGRWRIYCPLGISNVNYQNGEKRDANIGVWRARVQSSIDGTTWTTEYNIPAPTANNTWESWSYNAAITADSLWTALFHDGVNDINDAWVECADVTLTIDNDITVTAASELDNYPLECTITNDATGEAVTITAGMVLDQTLVVNTDEKSVFLSDGTRLATAVVTDTARRDWLRFVDGDNTLTFEETGAQEVEIDILWDRRLFE